MTSEDYRVENPNRQVGKDDVHKWAQYARQLLGPRSANREAKSSLRQAIKRDDLYGPELGPPTPEEA